MTHKLESIEDLKPAPYNPRKIKKQAAEGLAKSIDEFGDISGIVWNKRTGHLVCGHQRLEQLKTLGGVFHDGRIILGNDKTRREFPVRVVDWTQGKEKAANVEANNRHIAGDFTDDIGDLLGEIKLDLGDETFGELQLGALAKDLKVNLDGEIVEDEVPEPPSEPISRLGDVWRLGDHTVVCGDCRAIFGGIGFDCVVTDPPYPNTLENEYRYTVGVIDFLKPVAAHQFIFWTPSAPFPLDWQGMAVWDKCTGSNTQFELIYERKKGSGYIIHRAMTPHNRVRAQICGDVVSGHPSQKSTQGMAMVINMTKGRIVDPFLGSGTTLIAAEQLGRKCYGIEIEPKYVDVTIERWQNLTGGKAERIEKGKG